MFDNWQKAQESNTSFCKNKLGRFESQLCTVKNDSSAEAFKNLQNTKRKKPKNIVPGHLDINSMKNKFESFWELIKDTFDRFLLRESKLGSSFPYDQFSIPSFQILTKYRHRNGGGLLLYINEDISFKVIYNLSLSTTLEFLPIKIIKI